MNIKQMYKQKVFPFNLINKKEYPPCHNCISFAICKNIVTSYHNDLKGSHIKVTNYGKNNYNFYHLFLMSGFIRHKLMSKCSIIESYIIKDEKTQLGQVSIILDYFKIPKSLESNEKTSRT